MGTVTINGKKYYSSSGDISVINNTVFIDGKKVDDEISREIEIKIEGIVGNIKTDYGHVTCQDVKGNVNAGGSVRCENVEGDVDAGGSIRCGDVGKNVDAGGSVTCKKVEGDIDAGGSVKKGFF